MPNTDALNRTVFISDNLPFLQALDTESVDLIVIDPPFGKKQTFQGQIRPPLTDSERTLEADLLNKWGVYDVASAYEIGVEYPDQSGTTALFKDIWQFERVLEEDWYDRINDTSVWWLIESTRRTHDEDTAAYIAFMAQRMVEIRRILKPTGSVYLHCDHDANAYLRQMMDAVFGASNFRNEIIWAYTGPSNTRRWFPRKHDTILFYAKSNTAIFNRDAVRIPYRRMSGTGHNSLARGARTNEEVKAAEAEYAKRGKVIEDYWTDISGGGHIPINERTGYPTQKPQALAARIIQASSNPGDLVLDCFAGCAYVPVAAEMLDRRWIACDMSPRAWTVVRRQFAKHPDLAMTVESEEAEYDAASPTFDGKGILKVRGPNQLPQRSPDDAATERLPIRANLRPIRFRQKPLEDSQTIWQAFVDEWGTECWYCGVRQPPDRRYLQLDHIVPNKGDRSNDDCWNRALACIACNSDKSDRLTPAQTIMQALQSGRIETERQRADIERRFNDRHQWAIARWKSLPKPKRFSTLENPDAVAE